MRSQKTGERAANMGNKEEPSVPAEDVVRRLEDVVRRLERVLEKATSTGAIPKARRGGPRDKNGRQSELVIALELTLKTLELKMTNI